MLTLPDALSPDKVNYSAANPDGTINDRWKLFMMKQSIGPKTLEVKQASKGYVFNNSRDNVRATYLQLADPAGLVIDKAADDAGGAEASEENEA